MKMLAALDARGVDMRACPLCAAYPLGRWDVDRRVLRRLRYRACRRTRSATAGSPLPELRRPEAFRAILRDMIDADHPASCRRLAARLGVNRATVWRRRIYSSPRWSALRRSSGACLTGDRKIASNVHRESPRVWPFFLSRM